VLITGQTCAHDLVVSDPDFYEEEIAGSGSGSERLVCRWRNARQLLSESTGWQQVDSSRTDHLRQSVVSFDVLLSGKKDLDQFVQALNHDGW
jgi:hypothetical protein